MSEKNVVSIRSCIFLVFRMNLADFRGKFAERRKMRAGKKTKVSLNEMMLLLLKYFRTFEAKMLQYFWTFGAKIAVVLFYF